MKNPFVGLSSEGFEDAKSGKSRKYYKDSHRGKSHSYNKGYDYYIMKIKNKKKVDVEME
jgi:hypothetical protein